ncbi:MAG: hypothetical protein Q9160_009183 [Pyrenula sp. 1 TL-2023]
MKNFAALSLLLVLSPASAQLTYWVDSSCTNLPGNKFQTAFDDALTMARRGNMRFHSNTDTDQAALFQRIFKAPKTDRTAANQVNRILGMPPVPPAPAYGIAGMIPEPNNDRRAANVRYYCDDDPQNVNGGSRWTLRPDPNPLPQGYVPQRQRPPASQAQAGQAYQEWEDVANDITQLTNPSVRHPGIEAFNAMTSFVLLHEGTHLPGLDIDDLNSPNPRGNHVVAYGWLDVQDLATSAQSLNNADNYTYFSLLAVLADRHFRLSKTPAEARDGKLVYDLHGITSRNRVKGRSSKVKLGGRDVGWWQKAWEA